MLNRSPINSRPTVLVGLFDDALRALTALQKTYGPLAADVASTGLTLGPLITTTKDGAAAHVRYSNARAFAANTIVDAMHEADANASCRCRFEELVRFRARFDRSWADALLRMSDRHADVSARALIVHYLTDLTRSATLLLIDLQFHYEWTHADYDDRA